MTKARYLDHSNYILFTDIYYDHPLLKNYTIKYRERLQNASLELPKIRGQFDHVVIT